LHGGNSPQVLDHFLRRALYPGTIDTENGADYSGSCPWEAASADGRESPSRWTVNVGVKPLSAWKSWTRCIWSWYGRDC